MKLPILYRYAFTTVNFDTGTVSICTAWANRYLNLKRPNDYLQMRKELLDMDIHKDDPDYINGVLTHGELCGIKLFGIRVL